MREERGERRRGWCEREVCVREREWRRETRVCVRERGCVKSCRERGECV